MNVYLGRLNHVLKIIMVDESPADDGGLVCVTMMMENHSGVPGDNVYFRIHREDAIQFVIAFDKMTNRKESNGTATTP